MKTSTKLLCLFTVLLLPHLTSCIVLLEAMGSKTAMPLHRYAKKGDIAEIERRLQKGADINERSFHNYTPLMWAVRESNNLGMVKFLVSKKADVNAKSTDGLPPLKVTREEVNSTAWFLGTLHGQTPQLVEYRAEDGCPWVFLNAGSTPLIGAAIAGNAEIVKYLVENGADVHARDGKGIALLISNHATSIVGNTLNESISWQVSMGSEVNAAGLRMPLVVAAEMGRIEVVKYLMNKCSDVIAADLRMPLVLAAAKGSLDVVTYLVEKGADVNGTDIWGRTALSVVAKQRHPELVEYLKQHGAKEKVNAK